MTAPHQLISTGHNTNEQCQSTEGKAAKKHYKSMKVTHTTNNNNNDRLTAFEGDTYESHMFRYF